MKLALALKVAAVAVEEDTAVAVEDKAEQGGTAAVAGEDKGVADEYSRKIASIRWHAVTYLL